MGSYYYPPEDLCSSPRTMWGGWILVVLVLVWGGACWPEDDKVERKTMCLDSLPSRVRPHYGLLRPRGDWFTPDPGGGGGGGGEEESGKEDLKGEGGKEGNSTAGLGGVEGRHLEKYVLFASYDFRDSSPGGEGEGRDVNEEEIREEENLRGGGENGGDANKSGDERRDKRQADNGGGEVEDLFSLDFTLWSSEVAVPGWWLCAGFRSGRNTTFLTTVLVGGSILEESEEEAREEEIRARYGEYVLLASRREGEKTERMWRDVPERASAEVEDMRTPADESWAAIEELRELWRGSPVVQWSPPSETFPHQAPDHLPGSEDTSSNTNSSNTDDLPVRDALHSTRGPREEGSTCVSGPPLSPKPYSDYFSPSNITGGLLPGALPTHHLTHHLRLPFTSPWHSFRHTVTYHMHRTGILRYPNLAAATFRLSANSCPEDSNSPSASRFLPSGVYGRSHGSPWSAKTGVTVPVDVTPVVHSWLRHTRPWQRRSSKITLVMFLTDRDPRQHNSHDQNDTTSFNDDLSDATRATQGWEGQGFTSPDHHNRTQEEDSGKTQEEEDRGRSQEDDDGGDSHHTISDLLALNLLLRRDPPRLSLTYRMDESCRRRGRVEMCGKGESDPTCLCRIRPWCMDECRLQCDFERQEECGWEWQTDIPDTPFRITTGRELEQQISQQVPGERLSGVLYDASQNPDGQFLYLGVPEEGGDLLNNTRLIKSPWMEESVEECKLEADYNVKDLDTTIKVIIENGNYTRFFTIDSVRTDKASAVWKRVSSTIGHLPKKFRLGIEVLLSHRRPTHAAIDNIKLVNCFESVKPPGSPCYGLVCENGKCLNKDSFCDITKNCPGGEDEAMCDELPMGSRCNFEDGWCGWKNIEGDNMDFIRSRGPTTKERTGPGHDHTFKNDSGHYLLSELPTKGKLGDHGVLESPFFESPPCYHSNQTSPYFESCKLRLYYHKLGRYQGSLILKVFEYDMRGTREDPPHILTQIHGEKGTEWVRIVLPLPKDMYKRYKIQISNVRGSRFRGDLGIDDVTLSPECFGRNVPPEELKCPIRPTPGAPTPGPSDSPTTYVPPDGVVMVTTCGALGHKGPAPENCREEYHSNPGQAPTVPSSTSLPGTQIWKVPHDGYYTIVAKGASGGSGVQSQDLRTHGAIARATFLLTATTELYILVGQEGMSACRNVPNETREQKAMCASKKDPPVASNQSKSNLENLKMKINSHTVGGGGGGGGGSFVFMMDNGTPKALVVGGGAAGLAWAVGEGVTSIQDGQNMNTSLPESHGHALHNGALYYAGPGGGWEGIRREQEGQSLMNGGVGGRPCNYPSGFLSTFGGFGGGGGGCLAGGGGGGYTGGNAYSGPERHGEGGFSYTASIATFSDIRLGLHLGPGVVFIIPATKGDCGCDHMCMPLDEHLRERKCLCEQDQVLSDDDKTCVPASGDSYMQTLYVAFIVLGALVVALISATSIYCSHLVCNPSRRPHHHHHHRRRHSRDAPPATLPLSGWGWKPSGGSDIRPGRLILEDQEDIY